MFFCGIYFLSQEFIQRVKFIFDSIVVLFTSGDKRIPLSVDPHIDRLLLFLKSVHVSTRKFLVEGLDDVFETSERLGVLNLSSDLFFDIFDRLLKARKEVFDLILNFLLQSIRL